MALPTAAGGVSLSFCGLQDVRATGFSPSFLTGQLRRLPPHHTI